jgi:hypothetical protein
MSERLSPTQVYVLRNIRRAHLESTPRSWGRTVASLARRGLVEHHGWAHGWERTNAGDEALDAVRLAEGDTKPTQDHGKES